MNVDVIRFKAPIQNVLRITRQKPMLSLVKRNLNLSNPMNEDPKIPNLGLYWINAVAHPKRGR